MTVLADLDHSIWAVLVKVASESGVLLSPVLQPREVDIGDSWSFALLAAVRKPVVCEHAAGPARFLPAIRGTT